MINKQCLFCEEFYLISNDIADYINEYNRGKDKKTSKVDFINYCQEYYFVSNASLVDKNQKNFLVITMRIIFFSKYI